MILRAIETVEVRDGAMQAVDWVRDGLTTGDTTRDARSTIAWSGRRFRRFLLTVDRGAIALTHPFCRRGHRTWRGRHARAGS